MANAHLSVSKLFSTTVEHCQVPRAFVYWHRQLSEIVHRRAIFAGIEKHSDLCHLHSSAQSGVGVSLCAVVESKATWHWFCQTGILSPHDPADGERGDYLDLPINVFEAAALDGANWWQILWRITFPLLRRTTLFISTIAFISAFQTIDHIFVLTGGGPSHASTVLLFELWQERFQNQDIGLAATVTVILVVVLLLFTVTNFVLSERKEIGND